MHHPVTLFETRWLGLYRIGHWDFVRRPNSDAAVGILAITPDEEIILVEADGFGGAVLRVVEGNYPMDFYTREEQAFSTEAEALRAAELFSTLAV